MNISHRRCTAQKPRWANQVRYQCDGGNYKFVYTATELMVVVCSIFIVSRIRPPVIDIRAFDSWLCEKYRGVPGQFMGHPWNVACADLAIEVCSAIY